MKAVMAGLAAALAIGAAAPAFAADLPYGYGGQRVLRSDRVIRVLPVVNESTIRTTPWLRYEIRPEMACRLGWKQDRRGNRYPVEACTRW
ncbi:MAG TPA: hypothetical protein VGC51_06380 [Hansschlegelia sp.]